MKTIILFLFTYFFLMSTIGYSQENSKDLERNYAKNNPNQLSETTSKYKEKTITLYLKGLSKNAQGQIKDELLLYKEKIISLTLNEKTEVMVITYNTILANEKINTILRKNGYEKAIFDNVE